MKRAKTRNTRGILSIVGILVLFCSSAQAIIATPDSNGSDMPQPPDSFVYPWGPEASGFAISPTALLTSAHGGGGAWGFVIDGEFRMFCSWTPHPSGYPDGLDIGVAKLCPGQTPFRGFYRLYRGTIALGDPVTIAGSGIRRGAPLYSTAIGANYGWEDASYDYSLTRPVVYASNRISGINRSIGYNYELMTMFDSPTSGAGLPYEGSARLHDSGGLLGIVKNGHIQAAGMILSGGGGLYSFSAQSSGSVTMYRLLDRPDVLRWVKSQAPDAPICLPDIDGSQSLSVNDVFSFLRQWFQSGVDWNGDLMITVQDLLSFIDEWFTGC